LFNELGVEENQMNAAAEEYGFRDDPEFKQLMQQTQQAFRDKIQQQYAAAPQQ